ncbi:hypothetical protein VTK56DRAFT_3825 [Thermocarpiscus australiensis]
MSVTSEEEAEEDPFRLSGDREARNHSPSCHASSHSSGQSHYNDPGQHNQGNQDDNPSGSHGGGEDDAYPSASASANGSGSGTEKEDDEDEGDDDDGDDAEDDGPPPPPLSQHTFAPPFYGRPPTPLPPSPSLTSLLRPSRPTTPDASDDDNNHHHRHHPDHRSVPRARPKVPTYEYYGFVLYLFSSLSFLIYLLWSYLPSPFLHALGIYYYPNRWWSLAIPSYLVMLLVYMYVALAGYNLEILTLPLSSVETVVDEAAKVAVVDSRGRIKGVGDEKRRGGREREKKRGSKGGGGGVGVGEAERKGRAREREGNVRGGEVNWREVWNEGTDAVMDVPLAGVCEVLYGEGRDWESEEEDRDVVITRV